MAVNCVGQSMQQPRGQVFMERSHKRRARASLSRDRKGDKHLDPDPAGNTSQSPRCQLFPSRQLFNIYSLALKSNPTLRVAKQRDQIQVSQHLWRRFDPRPLSRFCVPMYLRLTIPLIYRRQWNSSLHARGPAKMRRDTRCMGWRS
jgi:hypothetical protein